MKLKKRNGVDQNLTVISSIGIWIGIINIVIGVSLIFLTQDISNYELFRQLTVVSIPTELWGMVYISIGVSAIRAIWEQSRKLVIGTFICIVLFWAWTGIAWFSVTNILPHGVADYVVVLSGSVLVIYNYKDKE